MFIRASALILTTAFTPPAFADNRDNAGAPHVGIMTMNGIINAPIITTTPKSSKDLSSPKPKPRPTGLGS